jgi:hypothetical protein
MYYSSNCRFEEGGYPITLISVKYFQAVMDPGFLGGKGGGTREHKSISAILGAKSGLLLTSF